ncbi:ABC transporter substrate-binding protein [Corynebacterium glyciniphilum]|uniref:ABC transporter substrate-binding protein n=1 Tax=Corynebacterium glyciniphilum TaxID=1404244 RepID=UPI001642E72D|nr:ABC transporter substrate-binding protein [Corynebacterium glyciniphilum]
MRTPGWPRRCVAVVVACACATGLASCAGSNETSESEGAATSKASQPAEASVPVEHAYGSTDVPVHPEQAISFSQAWSDAFASLGHPVATEVVSTLFDAGVPWSTEAAGESITNSGGGADAISSFGVEEIAAKNPDVIFAGYVPDQETFDALSAIAPTVATVGTGKVDDWREVTTAAGSILGDEDGAEDVIAGVDDLMHQVGEDHPAVDGATFAYAAYSEGSFSVISSPEDAANRFFTDLGMTLSTDDISGAETNRGISVSAENISLLDMDLLALWVRADSPDGIAGWSSLPSVEHGTAAELDSPAATALGAPTALSIPWLLDQLEPYFANL